MPALSIEGASSFRDGERDSIVSLSTNSLALDKSQPANHTISEARLLSDAKHGEPEAFEALCRALKPRLLKIALRITRTREHAEDAVQDSMMRAFVHFNDFHGDSSFSTWLKRIVMNSALMINRKNRSARQISADELPLAGEPGLHFQIPDIVPQVLSRPMCSASAERFFTAPYMDSARVYALTWFLSVQVL
jgi:RNA polymerase sigma factor (sigma-70 family)